LRKVQSEREQSITELEAKNAEVKRFAYTVFHALKNPLVTIGGFLGFVEKDALAGNSERVKADANRIREAVEKMRRLMDDLLELPRIGRLMNPQNDVPFAAIVREALRLTQGRLAECGVEVLVTDDLPMVYGDWVRPVEVVQNLVDTAAKYMGHQPQPHIEIGVWTQEGQPVFFVQDNGTGIEPRYHQKVFGLFDKLDPGSEGTGIGLALLKWIIELYGGRIWVESEGLGRGSKFCFTLPLTE